MPRRHSREHLPGKATEIYLAAPEGFERRTVRVERRGDVDYIPELDMFSPVSGLPLSPAFKRLKKAIATPRKPRLCSPCLISCITRIRKRDAWARQMRTEQHELLISIMSFLTLKRTDQQYDRLAQLPFECTCGRSREFATYPEDKDYLNEPFILVTRLFVMLSECLKEVDFNQVSKGEHKQRPVRADGAILWPVTPKDVMPYGPDITMHSICWWMMWMRQVKTSAPHFVVSTFASILAICRALVIDSILKEELMLGGIMCSLVNPLRSRHEKQREPGAIKRAPSWDFDVIKDTLCENLEPIWEVLRCAGHVFDVLINHSGMTKQQIAFFTRDWEDGIWKGSHNLIKGWVISMLPGVIVQIANFVALVYENLPEEKRPPLSTLEPRIIRAIEFRESAQHDPFISAYFALNSCANQHSCLSPKCHLTFEDSGRAFKACTGCRLVRYCSKECQKEGWRHDSVPHTSVCEHISVLAELNYRSSAADFEQECKEGGVQPETARAVADWYNELIRLREGPFAKDPVGAIIS